MDLGAERPPSQDWNREVNGHPSHFLEEGAGPTLFFVHDWMETAVGFGPLVRELGPRYRKIRVDLPGFGRTPVPEGFDHTLGAYGDFLNAALHETASRDATLVLHGFGLLVGLRALSVDGGESSRRVSRVVLLNGPLYDEPSGGFLSLFRKGPFEALTAAPPADLAAFRRRMLRLFGDPTYFDEGWVEELYHAWRPRGPSTLRRLAQHLMTLRETLPTLRGALKKWTGPVHVLWGEDDPYSGPEPAHRIHREVRRARVLIFPDVGYLPHAEAPKAVSDQIRKVVRVSRPPASSAKEEPPSTVHEQP